EKKEEQAWQEGRTEVEAVGDVCGPKHRDGCRPHKPQYWQAEGRPRGRTVPDARQDGEQAHDREEQEREVPGPGKRKADEVGAGPHRSERQGRMHALSSWHGTEPTDWGQLGWGSSALAAVP